MLRQLQPFAFLAIALFSGLSQADDCSGGPWKYGQYHRIGGQNGDHFCLTKWKDGITVRGLEVWANDKGVEGFQLTYSDESKSNIVGRNRDFKWSDRLEWDYKETKVTDLRLYGDGRGRQTGRIYIRLSNGQALDIGKDTKGQDVFNIDVQSGILLGADGRSGWHVDSVGFLFLKSKIKEITISDMKFKDSPENLNSKSQGLEVKTLDEDSFTNNGMLPSLYKFGRTIKVHQSRTFGTTTSHTFGVEHSMTASGQILGIGAESTLSLSYQYFNEVTSSETNDLDREIDFSTTNFVMPGKTLYCRASAMMGKFDGGYTSKMNILLEDGDKFTFAEEGTMKQVVWSKSESKCQGKPFDKSFPTIQDGEFEKMGEKKRGVHFSA